MPTKVLAPNEDPARANVCDWSMLPEFEEHVLKDRRQLTMPVIIIPVWNEGSRILNQLARMQQVDHGLSTILVDGGSTDGSTDHDSLAALGVSALLVTKERGLGTAIRLGLAYAISVGFDSVITIDGNGKDQVERIPEVVRKLDAGFDLVQASRFLPGAIHRNTPLDRLLGIKGIICPILRIASGFHYTDPTNGFKGLSRKLLLHPGVQPLRPELRGFNFQFFLNYIAPRLDMKVCEIAASRQYPDDGTVPTKINLFHTKLKLFFEFLRTAFGFYNVQS